MPRGTDENGIKWLPRKNTQQLYKCTSKNTNENNIKTKQTASHLIKNVITHAFQQPQRLKPWPRAIKTLFGKLLQI